MKLKDLLEKRAALLAEAGKLSPDGNFADDAARTAFDAKLKEVESLDVQIRVARLAEAPEGQAAPAAVSETKTRQQVVEEERGRVKEIGDAVRVAGLETTFAADMQTRGISIDTARAEIFIELEKRQKKNPTGNTIAITPGEDARDKQLRGAENWLLVRGGMAAGVAQARKEDVKTFEPGEFRGMSLVDLARHFLERAGRKTVGMDRMRLVSEALTFRDGGQSVSDFATLLENTMNKVLQAQYSITPDTWRQFCNVSTNVDFRAANRYRWGNLSSLDSLSEKGEFKTKNLSDAEKAQLTVSTKGNIISITRQMIVNDDMNAFARIPQMFGRASALSVEVDVYALLALNSGLGPTMSDTHPLFDAAHGNVGTGSALSASGIDADRVLMAQQKEPNGNDFTDLRPALLLIGVALGGQAKVINGALYDPDNIANKAQMRPNVVAGLFRQIVDSPRVTAISTTRRYLFADPAIAPVLEVAFLEGQDTPVLETKESWNVDGAELRVRFDYGVGAVDFRGAVTNAGA